MKPPDRKSIEPFVRPVEISLKERFQTVLTLSLPGWKKEFCKVVLTFESVDENLWCDHLNETFLRILLQGTISGADPGFFLGGGALVSCSTSTPINHIVFFLQNTSCIRKPAGHLGGGGVRTPCTLPLDPPLYLVFKILKWNLDIFADFCPWPRLAVKGLRRCRRYLLHVAESCQKHYFGCPYITVSLSRTS